MTPIGQGPHAGTWVNRLRRTASLGPVSFEVTPFVWNGRLYRVENHPRYLDFSVPDPSYRFHEDEIRIRDVEADTIVSAPLRNHFFGAGFVHGSRAYVYAGDYGADLPWRHHKRINLVWSDDLVRWSEPVSVIEAEGDELLFNTAVCRGEARFVLLYETNDSRWPAFTFKYCESDDLVHWRRIPGALYGTDRYVGGPALYYADGWYYTLYLESLPNGLYETRITRSRDLMQWHDAPAGRAVLPVDADHVPDPGHPDVRELSASDAELCAWRGRTLVCFHSGNQLGVAGLEQAEFDGPPEAFLAHYFDDEPRVELPDPFRLDDGTRAQAPSDWPRRRAEILETIVGLEYGGLPPTPAETRCEELHQATVKPLGGARFGSYRISTGPDHPFSFLMQLLVPPGRGPFPVVLTGDACWRYATDAVAAAVLSRGCILAQFNRVALAPDVYRSDRTSGLYAVYREGGYGALSAWAWGYHRCVDALVRMDAVDAARIAIVGHSRGGKTTLLAGATDERIALTCANNSGAGGAGCYRWQGPESERLADLIRAVPYWFGPRLKEFAGRESELPFDQHFLKALVAPRSLLTVEALGDLWANPTGTWQTHRAAREVYRFLGAEDCLALWYREGEHDHGPADWGALLDFMAWQFGGGARPPAFTRNPFPDLPRAFSWQAPRPRA